MFTCTFSDAVSGAEGVTRLQLYAEDRNGIAYNDDGWELPIIWFDVGETTIVLDEEDASRFIIAFDAETGDASTPWEPGEVMGGSCRIGGE